MASIQEGGPLRAGRSIRANSPEKSRLRTEGRPSDSLDFAHPPPLHPPHAPYATSEISSSASRPASISHSVAHPQMHPTQPTVANAPYRRASSFSTPLNPYAPTPVYPSAIATLTFLVHLGILIVLGVLLTELKKATAEFHTASNNRTGSYLRVGLYGGGLGASNRPFFIQDFSAVNATTATVPTL